MPDDTRGVGVPAACSDLLLPLVIIEELSKGGEEGVDVLVGAGIVAVIGPKVVQDLLNNPAGMSVVVLELDVPLAATVQVVVAEKPVAVVPIFTLVSCICRYSSKSRATRRLHCVCDIARTSGIPNILRLNP